ncbi:hypothetical protein [Delftia lacustris]|uniref:Uncharacterized protein n=1 Tax=Delftia lacustris TaxID=558537 RepID=A0A1H3THQ7_9BURK|nr:hypothetical protein [Delftia lacustris]SDZ49341.1 hypothetical protein SAMN05421547_12864 [Delftia lacustris]
MTHNTTPATPTADNIGSPQWAQALELFLGQMIEVLEGEGRAGFSAGALARWSELCCQRMQETGSATPEVIAQLRGLSTRATR